MFLLKKLFKLRDQNGGQSVEKPFLAHLEDLRDVITRIVLTLLVATLACYAFRDVLLDVLRRPIEQVWVESEKAKLPESITPELWEQAKLAGDRSAGLSPEQRAIYFKKFDNEKLEYYAECARYYRAASSISDADKRKEFIDDLPGIDSERRKVIHALIEKKASQAIGARGDVVQMRSLKPTETFMLAIKLAVFAAVIISFPLLLWFILQFVLPGLKEKEKKALWPAMIIGFGLFLLGVFFCYYLVLPKALDFFFSFGKDMGVENEWRIGEYIGFATQFTLIFGLAFELPVVVMTLVKIGLLGYETMRNTRAYAVLAIVIVAAVITPTGDALTLSMLAVPMYLLYEICIWLSYFHNKKLIAAEQKELDEIREYQREHGAYDEDDSDPSEPLRDVSQPRIVPVPGRISTDTDEEFIENESESYDFYADHDSSNEHGQEHDHHYGYDGDEEDKEHSEGEEMDDGEVDLPEDEFLEEDSVDFNPGASFEEEYGASAPTEEHEEDASEDSDKQQADDQKEGDQKKDDKKDSNDKKSD